MIALRWFFFFLWNASSRPGSIQHGAKDLVSTYFWIPATSNPLSNNVSRVPPPVLASGKKKYILLPGEKRSMHFGFVFNHFWHSVVLVKSDLLHLYKIFSLLIIWTAKIRGQALVISQLNSVQSLRWPLPSIYHMFAISPNPWIIFKCFPYPIILLLLLYSVNYTCSLFIWDMQCGAGIWRERERKKNENKLHHESSFVVGRFNPGLCFSLHFEFLL